MRPDDFFVDERVPSTWAGPSTVRRRLNTDLLTTLRKGPVTSHEDTEAAVALARLVHDDLERFGTGGGEEMTEHEMRTSILALNAVVDRCGVRDFILPFRDFGTFKNWWVREGASGSGGYFARRQLLARFFEPLHDKLAELETRSLSSTLADPVTAHPRTGLATVDSEIIDLRRLFQNASTAQGFSAVGHASVRVLEALSRELFDPQVHLAPGEKEPPVANTKDRLDKFIVVAVPGPQNAALRALARAAIVFAQDVKHRMTPTRRDAGVAADAVLLLANVLRRLQEPV